MSKTIIEHMSSISEKMRNLTEERRGHSRCLELSEENFAKAEEDIAALRERLGMNTIQVVIMTAILGKSARNRIDCDEIASYLGLDYLKFLAYSKDLEELKRRGYIRLRKDGCVFLPTEVLNSFKADNPVEPEKTSGLDTGKILSRMRQKFSLSSDDLLSYSELVADLKQLVEENPDTSVARCFREHCDGIHWDAEKVLFFAVLVKYYCDNDDQIGWFDVENYFDEDDLDSLKYGMNSDCLTLQERGVIEFAGEDGVMTKDYFRIKDSIKDEALADAGGLRKKGARVSASKRIAAGSILHKDLFYNPAEGRQVEQLHELMGEKRYAEIRAALQKKGLRTGFTCLFYGAPGTGKTETVYQLARDCGRDLFVVDVSQVKSCWVGESEKNIKDVFTKYRASLSAEGRTPILLFNEADAIFGIRKEGAGSAVDKMENSIQNIILQEMEDLDGILIATTNLTSNLDKAFERRFLYKVRFNKPSAEARSHIWTSMIPELSEAEAAKLAQDFDFSGGQIENISRKKTVKELIDGVQPTFEQILQFCSEETIGEKVERRRIGF